MCHLAGYIGNENCIPILLDSLEIQEGIIGGQATGIAYFYNNKIHLKKNIGPVKDFKRNFDINHKSTIGIGHTRYAIKNLFYKETNTVGKAHPFWNSDNSFVTMHNGTLSNYENFTHDLEIKGYKFKSKSMYFDKNLGIKVIDYCDSEIFSFLLEEEMKKNDDIKECIKNSCENLGGHFAFVVLHPDYPNEIFLANWMQPMYIGFSKDGAFFSSFKEGFNNIKEKFQWIFEPPKNVLVTLQKGKIISEPLLSDRKTPIFKPDSREFKATIIQSIKNKCNDLAGIWIYIKDNPESIGLTFEEYEQLSTIDGFTFSPLIYSYLLDMEKKGEVFRKLESVKEGGLNTIPRYKFYLVEK